MFAVRSRLHVGATRGGERMRLEAVLLMHATSRSLESSNQASMQHPGRAPDLRLVQRHGYMGMLQALQWYRACSMPI